MLKKLFRTIKNNDGFSLVELIISFALLSIFMTAACTLLTNYTKLYTHINTMALGENVAETVMNTIEDCVSDSSSVIIEKWQRPEDSTYEIWKNVGGHMTDSDRLIYKTPNGNFVTIFAYAPSDDRSKDDVGILRLLYSDDIEDVNDLSIEQWSLGKEAYMRYRVYSLKFDQKDNDKNKNVLSVNLEVKNMQTGSITKRTKLIECYGTDEIE